MSSDEEFWDDDFGSACEHECDEDCDLEGCHHEHICVCGQCGCPGYCDDHETYNLRFAETGGVDPGDEAEEHPMTTTRLHCLSPESASAVAAEAGKPEQNHRAVAEGVSVLLTYFDKRYPLDVADWAFSNGHCDDSAAGDVIAGL